MPKHSRKQRINLTLDPDIYFEARRYFDLLDMNMSGFLEMSLAQYLQALKPFEPLLDDIKDGKADPAKLKIAMRLFMANATEMTAENLKGLGQISREVVVE